MDLLLAYDLLLPLFGSAVLLVGLIGSTQGFVDGAEVPRILRVLMRPFRLISTYRSPESGRGSPFPSLLSFQAVLLAMIVGLQLAVLRVVVDSSLQMRWGNVTVYGAICEFAVVAGWSAYVARTLRWANRVRKQ